MQKRPLPPTPSVNPNFLKASVSVPPASNPESRQMTQMQTITEGDIEQECAPINQDIQLFFQQSNRKDSDTFDILSSLNKPDISRAITLKPTRTIKNNQQARIQPVVKPYVKSTVGVPKVKTMVRIHNRTQSANLKSLNTGPNKLQGRFKEGQQKLQFSKVRGKINSIDSLEPNGDTQEDIESDSDSDGLSRVQQIRFSSPLGMTSKNTGFRPKSNSNHITPMKTRMFQNDSQSHVREYKRPFGMIGEMKVNLKVTSCWKIVRAQVFQDKVQFVNEKSIVEYTLPIAKQTLQIGQPPKSRYFSIQVVNGQKYDLSTETEEKRKMFLDFVQVAIRQCKQAMKVTPEKVVQVNKTQLSVAEFEKTCETGDLIFFKGKSLGGKVTRFITRSQYDHVAMILKNNNGEIVLFESSGNYGCELINWHVFQNHYCNSTYEQVAFRHLTTSRTQDLLQKLDTFIKQAKGGKYNLSAKKLLFNKTSDQTYFCSELVATAYQAAGLFPESKSATTYWPSTLASDTLRLEMGASLSHLIVIV